MYKCINKCVVRWQIAFWVWYFWYFDKTYQRCLFYHFNSFRNCTKRNIRMDLISETVKQLSAFRFVSGTKYKLKTNAHTSCPIVFCENGSIYRLWSYYGCFKHAKSRWKRLWLKLLIANTSFLQTTNFWLDQKSVVWSNNPEKFQNLYIFFGICFLVGTLHLNDIVKYVVETRM